MVMEIPLFVLLKHNRILKVMHSRLSIKADTVPFINKKYPVLNCILYFSPVFQLNQKPINEGAF